MYVALQRWWLDCQGKVRFSFSDSSVASRKLEFLILASYICEKTKTQDPHLDHLLPSGTVRARSEKAICHACCSFSLAFFLHPLSLSRQRKNQHPTWIIQLDDCWICILFTTFVSYLSTSSSPTSPHMSFSFTGFATSWLSSCGILTSDDF